MSRGPTPHNRWVIADLQRVKTRMEEGSTWKKEARSFGVDPTTLLRVVRSKLGAPKKVRRRPRDEDKLLAAILLRNQRHMSWSLVHEEVEYRSTPEALAAACKRYAKRHNCTLPTGFPEERRSRWDDEA